MINLESILTQFLTANWGKFAVVGFLILAHKIWYLPKVKGWFGEKLVERGLRSLKPIDYHVFHDLYLPRPDGNGTTQIDHLVVSRFGIFVIETKNYQGWIFGSEKQRQWTQSIYKSKHRFQNPLQQNSLHINALVKLLELEKSVFYNLIFFIGNCTLKTDLSSNVMTRGLIPFIKKRQNILLSAGEVQNCLSLLEPLASIDNKRDVAKQHVQQLKQRQDLTPKSSQEIPVPVQTPVMEAVQETHPTPPTCPKCAQPMVERVAKKGEHKGTRFWGCSQFPKCRGDGSFTPIKN